MSSLPSRPQRLLITGGRGRLAPLIAEHFRGVACEPVLYSRGGGPSLREFEALLQPGELVAGDMILHLAWSTLPATSEQNPGTELAHDLPYLERMLDVLGRRPAEGRPHLVFFSSGGTVYGNAHGRPSREVDACSPVGAYGRGKLAAEELITGAVARSGQPATILRISNPYGYPVPSGRPQGVIPHAVRAALEGGSLTLWGDGSARKDFLHYTDFLAALQLVVERRLTGIYNVCAGESHSIREIIALVEEHTGRRIATDIAPAPAWDVTESRLDHARLTEATGWRPRIGLDEGIRRFVAAARGSE